MSEVEGALEFRILGALEARREGSPIALGAPKQRALLALLILRAGEVVSTDRLIDDLWGEAAPNGSAHTLQVFVSRLRKVLGSDAIVTRAPGYLLDLPSGMIDAGRFRGLVAKAEDELASERPDVAAERFERAFELWRGPALAEFAYEGWAREASERLEELRLGALERWSDARLALGAHRELVGELEQLVAEHPLRERFRAQLMMALYRSGRQTEALEHYAQARESLVDQLGIDPTPDLQTLYRQILNQDDSLAAPAARTRVTRHNLPAAPNPLVGRERELEELEGLLGRSDTRLVTLTGPGGTGKTRLALQGGAQALDLFPDGVVFCDLAPLRDSDLLASTIAQALGLSEQQGETSEQSVAAYVADKRLLLILDNFEQLLDDGSRLVARLLTACPNLRALATSRAPLRLVGEREFPVDSLALPAAVELFRERASLLGQDARARETIEAICERLDRLPLALELAAARLRSLSPERLLARLEQRLSLLTGGPRDAPGRQRTLRATLDWSYELLSPTQQRVLAGLGVFVGGCTLEAAEQVADADLETLDALIQHSLLRHRDDRYTMLETVREYALEQLERAGEVPAARTRHGDWALRMLDRADLREDQQFDPVFVRTLATTEIENLRQAILLQVERQPEEIVTRVLGVALVWEEGLLWREGIKLVQAINASQTDHRLEALARIQASLAWLALQMGDYGLARGSAASGIDAAEHVKDDGALIISLVVQSKLAQVHGEPDPETWNERALSLARAREDPLLICRCLSMLGNATADPEQARRCWEEALELAHLHGDRDFEHWMRFRIATIALREQRYEEAEQMLLLLLRADLGDSVMRADELREIGFVLAGRRANAEAARLIGASDAENARVGLVEEPKDRDRRAAAIGRIEAAIGKTATHEALREGRRLQIDEAVNLALSLFPQEPEPET